MATPAPSLQRRIIATLASVQVIGALGYSTGLAVASILAEDVSGQKSLSGLSTTFQVFGGALIAIPMARLMAARGRGPGLMLGYGLALIGAAGLVAAAVTGNFALLLLSALAYGGATASGSQAPYAAADLAAPTSRARDLSLVVWALTIGAVVGPNLVGPASAIGARMGLPELAGPYAFAGVVFIIVILIIKLALHPDPLLERRRLDGDAAAVLHGSITRGLAYVRGNRGARLGMTSQAIGHAVMVGVMVMTPVHMKDGMASLSVIGFVISIHILGMYAGSPLVGLAADRFGTRPVIGLGSAVLMVAALLAAATAAGQSSQLTVALFLLGVGWSMTYVAGSALLTNATEENERPGVQGASALVMGLAGGGSGALAGLVVGKFSFQALGYGAVVLTAALALSVSWSMFSRPGPRALEDARR